MDDNEKAKIMGMLDRVRAKYVALGEEFEAITLLLNAEPTPGQEAKRLIAVFCEQWAKRYRGQTYIPTYAKDIAMMKRLLKPLAAAEIERRIGLYLHSDDPFYANARHPLALFVSAINKFNVIGAADPSPFGDDFFAAKPVDCQHKPACHSDQEHTRRKTREMRGQA